ncbi:hypothetical protein CYG49_04705 [Candidatus Saccharibacteria bacterium]|nr:MAG: hypothetical protein CYG49_04705 [Candidatus Saccharibacteria bacterium]
MNSPEQFKGGAERGLESISDVAAERSKELLSNPTSPEHDKGEASASVERKKIEVLFSQEQSPSERKHAQLDGSGPSRQVKDVTKRDREASYKKTMTHIQSEMPAASRTFSKVIHIPVVEKTSDTIGSTLARPNALLTGSFMAFILVAAVYFLAKTFGYRLSGFETIAAFIAGWIIGIAYDYIRIMVTGKRTL